ncbi:MAG TPA: hypothetical protein VLI67_02375 [Vicinamibacteria bacterium]|nr:hypothetical protein [Vicinamibacteria bacterium]
MRLNPVLAVVLPAALAVSGCESHDPKAELEVSAIETYWVLDSPRGATQYMAPAIRFRVRNKSSEPVRSIQATANFRRAGEEESWGSAWEQVTPASKPLEPGKEVLVVLRSDGRYTSNGDAESMFAHERFRDARAELYLRVGSSGWVKMAEAPVDRRVGSRTVQAYGPP